MDLPRLVLQEPRARTSSRLPPGVERADALSRAPETGCRSAQQSSQPMAGWRTVDLATAWRSNGCNHCSLQEETRRIQRVPASSLRRYCRLAESSGRPFLLVETA